MQSTVFPTVHSLKFRDFKGWAEEIDQVTRSPESLGDSHVALALSWHFAELQDPGNRLRLVIPYISQMLALNR